MGRYGEDDFTGYDREDVYNAMKKFLEKHSITDLAQILLDVLADDETHD